MTTKKHDEPEVPARPKRQDIIEEKPRPHTEDAEPAHTPTDDPMSTPTWPVHSPNPPSTPEK